MATRVFELETTVGACPEEVIDFLMDLGHHQGLHPFLQHAEVVGEGVEDATPWRDWRVTERPAAGRWRYTITFPARTSRTSRASMRVAVRALPGCRLVSETEAVPAPGGTVLRERTVVSAPWPLAGYMARQAGAAHARTYERLGSALAHR